MEKFIQFQKLSKKEKKRVNSLKRNSWNNINPVSKKMESKKEKRKRIRFVDDEPFSDTSFLYKKENSPH